MLNRTGAAGCPLEPMRVLCASRETSLHAPFMKGPIRLALASGALSSGRQVALAWDPDHLMQRLLLRSLLVVCGRDQIAALSTRMWRDNLSNLRDGVSATLMRATESGHALEPLTWGRESLMRAVWPSGSRVLYLGCGTGHEVLRLQRVGLKSLGIDNIPELVLVAGDWAAHLGVPKAFAAMDASALGLASRSMDGFLLEFYSSLPYPTLTTAVRSELADVLKPNGVGVVVAVRLRYMSHWWLMGTHGQAPSLTRWLASHARHDCGFTERDRCEEGLVCGLYTRYHTIASATAELSGAFDVLDCEYEREDPRYVLTLVRTREGRGRAKGTRANEGCGLVDPLSNQAVAAELVERVERICAGARAHQRDMEELFSQTAAVPTEAQISGVLRSDVATTLTGCYLDCIRWANSAGYLFDWLV